MPLVCTVQSCCTFNSLITYELLACWWIQLIRMDGIENRKITVFAGALVCVYVLLVSTWGNSFAITFCIVPPSPSLTAQCVGKLGDKEHCLWTMGGWWWEGGCSSKEKGGSRHQKGREGGVVAKKGEEVELMIWGKDNDSFRDNIYQYHRSRQHAMDERLLLLPLFYHRQVI